MLKIKRYIELKENKEPVESLDNFYVEYDSLENAAELLDEDTIIVDFDERSDIAESIIKEIKTKVIKTKRGYHFYFKYPKNINIKNASKVTTIVGCKVDYKTGRGGKKAYGIIKMNGVKREVINEDIINYPFLPTFLFPTNTKESISNLEEGSRNNALFKHLFEVAKYYNEDKLLSVASKINDFMIHPLDFNELQNIVNSVINRNDKNIDVFDYSGKTPKLKIDKLADLVIQKLSIISYNNLIYFKNENGYITNNTYLLKKVLDMGFTLTKSQNMELIHQIEIRVSTFDNDSNDNLAINLKNGYQIKNGKIELSNGEFSPFNLDVNYNSDAYDKNVDDFINWFVSNDKEVRQLIEEILGHIIMTRNFPQISFFFVAYEGKNGKSTFFQMINNFAGKLSENLALEEMNKMENLSVLRDKLVNCGDDIKDDYILSSREFKNLVSGNTLMVRELYSSAKPFRNKATLLFSANSMPRFKDKSGGIERRVRIIPCKNRVHKADLSIDDKLSTDNAKSYLLNLALKGVNSIIKNSGNMINPQASIEETNEYLTSTDPFKSFLQDAKDNDIDLEDAQWKIFEYYKSFCSQQGFKAVSKNQFSRNMKNVGYTTTSPRKIDGKSIRFYIKEDKLLAKKGVLFE